MIRRTTAAVLVVTLAAQSAASLAAAVGPAETAATSHRGAPTESGTVARGLDAPHAIPGHREDHHHPGCPWRERNLPCPHEAEGYGSEALTLVGCSDHSSTLPVIALGPAIPTWPHYWRAPDLDIRGFALTPGEQTAPPLTGADPPPPRPTSSR